MTREQRIQLVGLIHQYGGAMSAGDMQAVAAAIREIRGLLDVLSGPSVVEIGGVRVEI